MTARRKRAAFLTQLTLQNVKSFLGEHTLDLTDGQGRPARWTLILGDNGVGEPPAETVETSLTYSRKDGKSENIKTSEWGKANNVVESKWGDFSKFQDPLILAYGAGRHMGVGNLDFSKVTLPSSSVSLGVLSMLPS